MAIGYLSEGPSRNTMRFAKTSGSFKGSVMRTYLKNGDGFIALNYYEDGAEVRLKPGQEKYLLLGGRIRPNVVVAAKQEANQEVKIPRKKGSSNADGCG
jgi:hypothetical protein